MAISDKNTTLLASAILLGAVIIGGAILIKGSSPTQTIKEPVAIPTNSLAPLSQNDRTLGNPKAKVTLVMYEDFQCPFCGAVSGLEPNSEVIKSLKQRDASWTSFMPYLRDNYVKNGQVLLVYRDFSFLGQFVNPYNPANDESIHAAEAARCASEQGKFWEYHDYLYGHQNGENQGSFSIVNLESFAKTLGLDTKTFNQCLETHKYAKAVSDSTNEGRNAGVSGTPKGFILVNGKIVNTIDGAEPLSQVKPKIDAAINS